MEEVEIPSDTNKKELREKDLIKMFKEDRILFKLVSTGKKWNEETQEFLLCFKSILQKQLPKMPK